MDRVVSYTVHVRMLGGIVFLHSGNKGIHNGGRGEKEKGWRDNVR